MTKNRDISKILDQNTTFTASLSVGSGTANILANSTILKLANSTVNTAIRVPTTVEYAGNYYLHANGTWQLVSAGATPGGSNTYVQFNDSTALGGTAGFTFNKDTNNVLIANTLTVGASGNTINSTVWTGKALTANDSTNLGGTAAASYQLNSTLAANVATMTANNATWHGTSVFANSTGAYPTSNSVGAVLGNTISRVIITGNSATFSSTLAATDTTITGFVNATTVVNFAAHTVGTTFIANTLGVYHTGTINAASFTTTGFLANTTVVVPTSNSSGQTLGNTISRWVITANSITTSGDAVIGGLVNAVTSVNSALVTVGTAFIANTLGAYHTGTVNAASFTTTGFRANTIGTYPTSNSSGQNFGNTISRWAIFANTIDVTTSITANGALGTATQILTSNSLGGVYWAAPSGGGNVTKVGTPVDDQVGVWTGDGTIEGTAAFTFTATGNNVAVANTVNAAAFTTTGFRANATHVVATSNSSGQTFGNTLSRWVITANSVTTSGGVAPDSNTVGTALGTTTQRWVLIANTIESTGLANVSALNVVAATNTATLFATTSAAVGANVLANATTIIVGNSIVNTMIGNNIVDVGNSSANIVANSTILKVANATANSLITPASYFTGNSIANLNANSLQLTVANATSNTIVTPASFFTGNSVANMTANLTVIKLANSTSNTTLTIPSAADWAGSKFLHANGTWASPTASAAAGGPNTAVQFNDSTAIAGNAAFTFDKATNTVFFANTLTSGNSTINLVANSTTLLLSNSSSETITANSAALAIGNSTVNNTLNSVCIAINISPTANLTSNSVLVQLANNSGTSNLTPTSLAIATSLLANSTGLYPGSNTVGQNFGNTISRWDIDAIKIDLAAGNTTAAPIVVAAGTNLTTAAAGAIENDGKCFYASTIASTRQVADCEQLITLTSAFTLANQTAAQKIFNSPTNGTVTVGASTTYFFECAFSVTAMSAISNSYGFALGGTATYTRQAWWAMATKAAGALTLPKTTEITYNTAASLALTTASTSANGIARIWGKAVIGTGGTIIPQISMQGSVNTATTAIGNDSYFRIWPAGLNTVQSVGNWS